VLFHSIRWRIAVSYVALILVTMLGLAVYVSNRVREAHLDDLETQLLSGARLMADGIASWLGEEPDPEKLDQLARHWADMLGVRVTVIGADGTVLGESHEDRAQMDNHLGRPEVQQALSVGQGRSIRFSRTVGYEMMYAALPVMENGQVVGVMRVSLPLRQVEANVDRTRQLCSSPSAPPARSVV
jgi:two-component system phosphate regulon sensor histidine kinase PhoR